MKNRIITIVFLLLGAYIHIYAQAPTKQEIKAQKRAEKAEARRIQDSIWNAEYEAQMQAYREQEMRRNANTLIIETTYQNKEEAFAFLINALLDSGYLIAEKDKEYCTIKTEIKDAGLARYDLAFRAKETDAMVVVEISGRIHTTFAMYGIVRTSAMPLVNKGVEGSANKVGFGAMERFANLLPHTTIKYIER